MTTAPISGNVMLEPCPATIDFVAALQEMNRHIEALEAISANFISVRHARDARDRLIAAAVAPSFVKGPE